MTHVKEYNSDAKMQDIDFSIDNSGDFERYRRLLFAIAYRMVGTAMEAEDIVQESYLRYQSALPAQIDNLKAYLTTITTRLSLDYLKSAQTQRQSYFGVWLPEPTFGDEALLEEADSQDTIPAIDPAPSPSEVITQQESISMAFLVILEQLTPVERAVLLLRGVFDYDYSEIASIVDKSEANVRQIFHRAQAQVRSQRPRFEVSPETHAAVVNQFLAAMVGGEMDRLLQMLTEDVTFTTDSGGKASAIQNQLSGQEKVARLLIGLVKKWEGIFTATTQEVNGRLSVLFYNMEGGLESTLAFEIVEEQTSDKENDANHQQPRQRISNFYVMRNPDKLARYASLAND